MDEAMSLVRRVMVFAVAVTLMLCAGVAIANDASAHVRDRDKVALCNGDGSQRRHFHEVSGPTLGYYYYIQFDYWSGIYIHYDVWKTSYLAGPHDRANKVVNCNNY